MSEFSYGDEQAPTSVSLWSKTHIARKPRLCDICGDPINIGDRYSSSGFIVDGEFHHWARHYGGEFHPSGCPRQGAIDRAELAAQFSKDAERYFPSPSTPPVSS